MGFSCYKALDSLLPVIQVLTALNWKCLSNKEAISLRSGRKDQAVLTGLLAPWIESNNRISVKGKPYAFTKANVNEAIRRLSDVPPHGLVKTSEEVYQLLTLGTSLEQTIAGDRKAHTLKYIDWRHPEKNLYHLSYGFMLERSRSYETRQLDVVLFVNGIPFVVLECPRQAQDHDPIRRSLSPAISRLIQLQGIEEIPQLFHYAQLLLATSASETRYGTTGTPLEFWSNWVEHLAVDAELSAAMQRPLSQALQTQLFTPEQAALVASYYDQQGASAENKTAKANALAPQEAILFAMLRPQRLLEFIYQYVVYDSGVRKVARYPQYFAVKAALKKVSSLKATHREGGVIWHTTGSGKSLTMVLMAKALALYPGIDNPFVVLVTDRIDLDDQLWRTFDACGKSAVRAKTGEHLMRLISEGKASLITTVIDKFCNVIAKHTVSEANPNIFVLVDEGHRSNYGVFAERMRRVFTNACYIGFTGTPLLMKEKNTARKFGGFIHRYTLRQAVADGAVVPLLYEGRMALLQQNAAMLQANFERMTENLSDAKKTALKRRLANHQAVNKAAQRIEHIAFDISAHFATNYKGTGLKAQLATSSRADALQYRQYINDYGLIQCELIMSQPNVCEGLEDDSAEKKVTQFWQDMMARFGSEEAYLREIKASFARQSGCDLLIVVDKLLTGFDEPRNTILYIDKPLKNHNLLQAIARVNRIFPGKHYGVIVDYHGVLGHLNQAMQRYEALSQFDTDDVNIDGAIIDTHDKIHCLAQSHSDLWAVFDVVKNMGDSESMVRCLRSAHRRQLFHQAYKRYQQLLAIALSTDHFYQEVSPQQIATYKYDLSHFQQVRATVQRRFSETIDIDTHERHVRKIMDAHLQSKAVVPVTGVVDVFDITAFDQALSDQPSKVAKADMIASRVKRAINDKERENGVLNDEFSHRVQRSMDEFYEGRISEAEYLEQQTEYLQTFRRGHALALPATLRGHPEAQAMYPMLTTELLASASTLTTNSGIPVHEEKIAYKASENPLTPQQVAQMALDIERIIEHKKIRDWPMMDDVVKQMQNTIDDYLFDMRDRWGIHLSTEKMDKIIEQCLTTARKCVED